MFFAQKLVDLDGFFCRLRCLPATIADAKKCDAKTARAPSMQRGKQEISIDEFINGKDCMRSSDAQ